ncbi:hypothetical protein BKA93DRAFT_586173 [Sparassis latifolia]
MENSSRRIPLTCVNLSRYTTSPHSICHASLGHGDADALIFPAGIFASLVLHVAGARILYACLVAAAAAATRISAANSEKVAAKKMLPSPGALSAVYATVVVTALAFPNNSVSLIFLPGLYFSILWGVGEMVVMDVMGGLRGWALFERYAHLGEAAFGTYYVCMASR